MSSDNPFAGDKSSYDPSKVWLVAKDPDGERYQPRNSVPLSAHARVLKFVKNDKTGLFYHHNQVYTNAFHHGLHTMEEHQGYEVAPIAKEYSAWLEDCELKEANGIKRRMLETLRDALREALTDEDRERVRERIAQRVLEATDPQFSSMLRALL